LLTRCASRLTPVEKVLFRRTNGAISQAIRGACSGSASSLSTATPGRIETDGSRTAKGILARYQRFVRSRGEPEVSLDRRRNLSSPSSVARAGAGDWDVHFVAGVGFRASHGAGSGLRWSVRQRTAGAPRGARHVVKSGAVPGSDRSPVCSGFVSIAEFGECCRARSGTPSVAADGGIERAKPAPDESQRR